MTATPDRDLFGARRGEYELPNAAVVARCRSCNANIVWIKTANGKAMPLSLATVETRDGVRYAIVHWADCPDAKEWSTR